MTRQLELFELPATSPMLAVGPALPDPELLAIARLLPPHLHLGASSWSFPGWVGLVYDRTVSERLLAREGLHAYARHPLMRTVSLDRTFYGPIDEGTYARLAASVPEDFRFLVKSHEGCTWARFPDHPRYGAQRGCDNPCFLDPAHAIEQVIQPCVRGLGRRLGVILFQFPPQDLALLGNRPGFADRLRAFLLALPRGPRYAVEIRNHQLLTPRYMQALRAAGAVHCFSVHPRMHELGHQMKLIDLEPDDMVVVRWMLCRHYDAEQARSAFSPYAELLEPDPKTRRAIATLIERAASRPTLVIIGNDAEGCAPQSIEMLARALTRSPTS